MTENAFPFGADEPLPVEEEPGPDRRRNLVAGGLAAALVLGAGGYLLLGGGGSEPAADTGVVRALPRPAKAKPVAAKPATAVQLPTRYKEQLGRDPFRALYVPPVVAPAGQPPAVGAPPGPAPGTAPAGTAPGGTAPAGTAPGGTGRSGTAPTGSTPTARYALKLLAISKPSPEVRYTTWTVDGQKKTVIPGQRFGKYGELVVLAYSQNDKGVVDKAILQVGDDSPIAVAVGETNTVM